MTDLSRAADWPHWRGAGRNGVVAEDSGWDRGAWPLGKPAWTRDVGQGSTSPLVVGGKLYTLGSTGAADRVVCLDTATGKTLWTQMYRCPLYGRRSMGDKGMYSGPCATPEFDTATGYLYTLSTDGDLNCWDTAASGRRVWGLNLYDRYSVPRRARVGRSGQRDYGYTCAPLVWKDWLIVEVGAEEAAVIAFDKRTGREVWRSQARDSAGHAGGMAPLTVGGAACLAVMNFSGLLVLRLDGERAGQTVATYPWKTSFANNIASPAAVGNHVLITSGYNMNAMCKLEITSGGARQAWRVDDISKVCTPVIHNGRIYVAWRELFCLDFNTGKRRWTAARKLGDPGSVIVTSDDRVIAWTDRGELVLANAADGKVLSRQSRLATADAWPHLVLSGGRLFLKDRRGRLSCYPLKRRRQ